MQATTTDRHGWRRTATVVAATAGPYWFAACGLGLGVASIVQDEPVAGACAAVAGVTVALILQRRVRFHRDHADALRERLRTHRLESEEVAAQLRQTVSALQTEVWQHRMVALATPAYGIPVLGSPAEPAETPPEQVARAS